MQVPLQIGTGAQGSKVAFPSHINSKRTRIRTQLSRQSPFTTLPSWESALNVHLRGPRGWWVCWEVVCRSLGGKGSGAGWRTPVWNGTEGEQSGAPWEHPELSSQEGRKWAVSTSAEDWRALHTTSLTLGVEGRAAMATSCAGCFWGNISLRTGLAFSSRQANSAQFGKHLLSAWPGPRAGREWWIRSSPDIGESCKWM